jgi:polyhydroxybutyrate depolymerase
LAGCGASAADPPDHAARPCFRASGHREVAGELVDIPRRLPAHPPLLVVFHGLHESASYLAGETGFDDVAAQHHFVVAYPNALEAQRWQPHDVDHIRGFIDRVVGRVCADPDRVYLTGFSNGATFAYRAGCDLHARIAAIAPVSGSYHPNGNCVGAMPTLELHGRDPWTDTVMTLIAETNQRNDCRFSPTTSRIARGIDRTVWPGCDLERIYNRTIGHEWPKLGPYNTSAEVWRFVSRYRR